MTGAVAPIAKPAACAAADARSGRQAGTTSRKTVAYRPTPSASDGTNRRVRSRRKASSARTSMNGKIMIPRTIPAASSDSPIRSPETRKAAPNSPRTIEGIPAVTRTAM